MTSARAKNHQASIAVALIGAEAERDAKLIAESLCDFHIREVAGIPVFDDGTDTWLLDDGRRARVVLDARVQHGPPAPDYVGHELFRGPSLYAWQWPVDFDPQHLRIAVIGNRAAHVVPKLGSATVRLFDCAPNWQVRKAKRRWARRRSPREPELVSSPVAAVTQSGVRTQDGVEHTVDAIAYATDTDESYLGIAQHGRPNYFTISGTATTRAEQLRYIGECLTLMQRKGATHIEVRRSAQRQFIERARVVPPRQAFEFTAGDAGREVYDGPATLTVGGDDLAVRVRLTGRLDPIDGKYHWQGTVFGATAEIPSRPVTLAVDSGSAEARITEQTPWGYAIAGVGAPPFN